MPEHAAQQIIERASRGNRRLLTEYEAKQVLAAYGIPVNREILVNNRGDLARACNAVGYPLVLKGVSTEFLHKTEHNLVYLDIRSEQDALQAYEDIVSVMGGLGEAVLVQEMVSGRRELVMGLKRDPHFGPCVMFGLGGIFTEILRDVVFRKAPLSRKDAQAMMKEIRGNQILETVRGMEAADRDAIAAMLISIGAVGLEFPRIAEIDMNPVILSASRPVVVDAAVFLDLYQD